MTSLSDLSNFKNGTPSQRTTPTDRPTDRPTDSMTTPNPPLEAILNLIQSQHVEPTQSNVGLTRRILTSQVRSRTRHTEVIDEQIVLRVESGRRRLARCGDDEVFADRVVQFLLLLKNTGMSRCSQRSSDTSCKMRANAATRDCKLEDTVTSSNNGNNVTKLGINTARGKDDRLTASKTNVLLRELLYSLQCGGLATSPSNLSVPSKIRDYVQEDYMNVDMVYKVAETACLVYKLERCVQNAGNSAMGAALRAQLHEFYKMVAVLEARLADGKLTLRQLHVYLRTPHNKLKLLCTLGEVVPDISLSLQVYSNHASPIHKETMAQISSYIITPQWKMVHDWVFYGKLSPSFFIGISSCAGWMNRYYIKKDKIPSFLGDDGLPELLLSAGRDVNFINTYLSSKFVPSSEIKDLHIDAKKKIETLSLEMNKFITNALTRDHDLYGNIYTLKQYFLLAKGDFWSIFIASAGNTLEKSCLKKYELEASMTSAVVPSLKEHFDRVQVRIEENTTDLQGVEMKGWDMFNLDYVVDVPLSVVISAEHIKQYQTIFSFLFSAYKVDWKLSQNWQLQIHVEHLLQKLNLNENKLRMISLNRQRMFHFIRNLHSYLQFEKLDLAWKNLVNSLSQSSTLSDFVIAHDAYLSSLLPSEVDTDNLKSLFVIISRFCDHSHDELLKILRNLKRIKEARDLIQKRIANGGWGVDLHHKEIPLKSINIRLMESDAEKFEELVLPFLDISREMKSFAFCLQFNEYLSS